MPLVGAQNVPCFFGKKIGNLYQNETQSNLMNDFTLTSAENWRVYALLYQLKNIESISKRLQDRTTTMSDLQYLLMQSWTTKVRINYSFLLMLIWLNRQSLSQQLWKFNHNMSMYWQEDKWPQWNYFRFKVRLRIYKVQTTFYTLSAHCSDVLLPEVCFVWILWT